MRLQFHLFFSISFHNLSFYLSLISYCLHDLLHCMSLPPPLVFLIPTFRNIYIIIRAFISQAPPTHLLENVQIFEVEKVRTIFNAFSPSFLTIYSIFFSFFCYSLSFS